ncbi:MAG: glycosyltransferase family 2 protein [Pseudomonadota bacterium]
MHIESDCHFSVVVPCFNEQESIAETIDQLTSTLADTQVYEIVVVDDGSADASGAILKELAATTSHLRVITHAENRGYGAALKTGIQNARAELIAITDADGTYPNERLPELIDAMADADMVVGARIGENVRYSTLRAFPKWFMRHWVSWISRQRVPDFNSGMRVFRRDLAVAFYRMLPDTFSFTTTITLLMLTNYYRVKFVPIDYAPRVGKSKIKPLRDTMNFLVLIARTGTYFAPLRVMLPASGVLALAAMASIGYDISQGNLTDKSILLALFSMNTGMFALLADMVDKRSRWK